MFRQELKKSNRKKRTFEISFFSISQSRQDSERSIRTFKTYRRGVEKNVKAKKSENHKTSEKIDRRLVSYLA